MASKLVEKRAELAQKQKHLAGIFEASGADYDLSKAEALNGFADSTAKAGEIKRLNDEMTDIGREVDGLLEIERVATSTKALGERLGQPANGMVHSSGSAAQPVRPSKSLGQLFAEHPDYLSGVKGGRPHFGINLENFEMKTVLDTGTGWAPAPVMTSIMVPFANRRPMVASLIPTTTTTQSATRYMEETTFTNAAAPVAEKGSKPEAALAFTERTVPVEVIAVWLPITRQQLDDVPAVRGVVDDRLTLMLLLQEEVQLLTGNGATPNLSGFLTKAGVQTQAKGVDPTPDAIFKAMTLVRNTGMADPTAVIFHPNDWQDVRLLRTADGVYIWGSPADAGPERIWGVTVISTVAETENTALTGDFQLYSHISRRLGIQIDVSDSHSDYFIKNQLAIRAEERLSLEIYRPTAFCRITGV